MRAAPPATGWAPGLLMMARTVGTIAVVLLVVWGCNPPPTYTTDAQPAGSGPDQGVPEVPCTIHHDCPQGWYCYYNKCVQDPDYAVFHCGKKDPKTGQDTCPPGKWCVTKDGKRSTCAESTTYECKDACDCGPAHCCIHVPALGSGKRCVKDTEDFAQPGGTAVGGAKCNQGTDATYCMTDPACHVGLRAYSAQNMHASFISYNDSTQTPSSTCGGKSCFGTACNCASGQSCVDTAGQSPVPGRTCGLLSGGECVSNAVAETVFGFKPSELLPCCSPGCPTGQQCEAGWISDRRWTYQRIVATCGSCGNGTCDPGEYPQTCAKDCFCGDGVCSPSEVVTCADCTDACGNGKCDSWETGATCSKDCSCGDGTCSLEETPANCPADCTCGDGLCGEGEICSQDCKCPGEGERLPRRSLGSGLESAEQRVCGNGICSGHKMSKHYVGESSCEWWETCLSCPQDCGKCHRVVAASDRYAPPTKTVHGLWGSSASNIWAVGEAGTILHFDGKTWTGVPSPTTIHTLKGIWGNSATDIWAVGHVATGSVILHYDGKSWTKSAIPPVYSALHDIWGSSASDIWAVGDGTKWGGPPPKPSPLAFHYDGSSWKEVTIPSRWPSDFFLERVWGSSASDIWMVASDGSIVHYDGEAWSRITVPATVNDIWGSSGTDIWAVGYGKIMHYDGATWKEGPAVDGLSAVWGSSATDVWAVGDRTNCCDGCGDWTRKKGMHYDGKAWEATNIPDAVRCLNSVWANSPTEVWAAGGDGIIIRFDGNSWSVSRAANPPTSVNDVWGSSTADVWAVGSDIVHFDGTQWTRRKTMPNYASLGSVWGSSVSDVWATGYSSYSGSLGMHYDGKSWKPVSTDLIGPIWGTDTHAWALGPTELLFFQVLLHYDGQGWTEMPSPLAGTNVRGIWGSSDTDVWLVGMHTIQHYDGKKWALAFSSADVTFTGVWGASPTDVWAVGTLLGQSESDANGLILHYNGKAWTTTVLPEASSLFYVWGSSSSDVWFFEPYYPSYSYIGWLSGGAVFHYDGVQLAPARLDLRRWKQRTEFCDLEGCHCVPPDRVGPVSFSGSAGDLVWGDASGEMFIASVRFPQWNQLPVLHLIPAP